MCLLYTIWKIVQDYLRPHHLEMTNILGCFSPIILHICVKYICGVLCVSTYKEVYTPPHTLQMGMKTDDFPYD